MLPCGNSSRPTENESVRWMRRPAQDLTTTFGLGTGPKDLGLDPAAPAGYADHPARTGYFTHASVCTAGR